MILDFEFWILDCSGISVNLFGITCKEGKQQFANNYQRKIL